MIDLLQNAAFAPDKLLTKALFIIIVPPPLHLRVL